MPSDVNNPVDSKATEVPVEKTLSSNSQPETVAVSDPSPLPDIDPISTPESMPETEEIRNSEAVITDSKPETSSIPEPVLATDSSPKIPSELIIADSKPVSAPIINQNSNTKLEHISEPPKEDAGKALTVDSKSIPAPVINSIPKSPEVVVEKVTNVVSRPETSASPIPVSKPATLVDSSMTVSPIPESGSPVVAGDDPTTLELRGAGKVEGVEKVVNVVSRSETVANPGPDKKPVQTVDSNPILNLASGVVQAQEAFSIHNLLLRAREKIQFRKRKKINRVLELARVNGKVSSADARKNLRVSKRTAVRYLNQLVKEGRMRRSGKSKAIRYELK